MKTRLLPLFFLFAMFFASVSFLHAQSSCCGVPDSLKVTNITNSGFCLSWRINDSVRCDTPKGFQLQVKPTAASTWTTRTKVYPAGVVTYTLCDSTATACTNFQWRVRNICIKNGDTTFSAYVNGPNFKTKCGGFTGSNTYSSSIMVYPNPAYDKVILKAAVSDVSIAKVIIANMNGRIVFEKNVTLKNGNLDLSVNIAQFEKGVYFVTVSNGKEVMRTSFTKH